VRNKTIKRNAKKRALALLVASAFLLTVLTCCSAAQQAQATQSASTDKPQAPPANGAGVVWINTDTGVYHKRGTRWYGKTKHGKYMLETDAIKAGYKPAK
jgi:hypothetical protein